MADENMEGLLDIAGIEMDAVEENRGGGLPIGVYQFTVEEAKLDKRTVTDPETKEMVDKPLILVALKVASVETVADAEIDADKLIGKTHNHDIMIFNPAEDIGRFKALVVDAIGETPAGGTLNDWMTAFAGQSFIAPIKHRTDKNDKDKKYSQLDLAKIRPAE